MPSSSSDDAPESVRAADRRGGGLQRGELCGLWLLSLHERLKEVSLVARVGDDAAFGADLAVPGGYVDEAPFGCRRQPRGCWPVMSPCGS
jgi:hypothetical protein